MYPDKKKTAAIILAGGSGTRMGMGVTKQRLELLGKSLLYRSALAFSECPDIDSITVVVRSDEVDYAKEELRDIEKLYAVVIGGETRAKSAECGFLAIPGDCDFVAIHDAARPLIKPSDISLILASAREAGAASAVSCVADTVKAVDEMGMIISTVDRDKLRCAETPQVFSVALYKRALIQNDGAAVTDDNMLIERLCEPIRCVDLGGYNIKITTPIDLKYAEFLLTNGG